MARTKSPSAVGRLFFFNYGSNLLRPGASNWILIFWFLAVAMAVLEGLTWGRILSVFLPENLPWVAALVGFIWGVAILAVDSSYATLDTAPDYRKSIVRRTPQTGWRASLKSKVLMGTLARLSIVFVSMAITGPFLAHTLEERKVVQAITAQNDQTISVFRASAAQSAEQKISVLDGKIEAQRNELVRETAGKSLSGHIGCGPVCRAMQANIASLEIIRDRAKADMIARLQALEAMSPAQLEQQEGLRLLHDNADVRAQIRKRLQRDSGETILGLPASDVIASSLFLLLFVMMAMLKICQPRSVLIYFNEHLQEAYAHYLNGGFAVLPVDLLRPADRHDGPSPMGAQRFDAWYHEVYLASEAKLQSDDQLQRLVTTRAKIRQRQIMTETELATANGRKWKIEAERQEAETDVSELEEKIMSNDANIKRTRLAQLAAQRADLEVKQHDADERKTVNDARIEQNEDRLGEVMGAIRRTEDRLGILVHFGEHSNKAANDPNLPTLYASRTALMGERAELDIARKHIDGEIEQIMHSLERVEAAVTACDAPNMDDTFLLEPEFEALAEERRTLKREKETIAARKNGLEEQFVLQEVGVAALKHQADRDGQQIAEYDEEIRRREVDLDLISTKKAA